MGIDTHSLHLLRYATQKSGGLGNTITLGRLTVLLGPHASRKWLGTTTGAYCEPLLKERFGASKVDSTDNSTYEGATIVADLNHPVPEALVGQYDAVLDFGCTEHIFDVAQSLRNVTSMCKLGGLILHVVPANGFCGHGFWQFSPELFFSWYCASNGYVDTEVYLADLNDSGNWYRVAAPTDGRRVNVRSSDELYVLVVTRRITTKRTDVQQSDYEFTWAQSSGKTMQPHTPGRFARVREILSKTKLTARPAYRLDSMISGNGPRPLRSHPALTRVPIRQIY